MQFRDSGFVKSMIVITHDVSVLYQIADTITIMYAGKLAEKAATDVLIKRPRHPYTRMLLAAVPHLHERWSAAEPGAADRPGLDGACLYHRAIGEASAAAGSPSLFADVEAGHLVACAHVDDPAGCPEARPVA